MAEWILVQLEGMDELVTNVATSVASDYRSTFEPEDLAQEAWIILASENAAAIRQYEEGGPAHVGAWLRQKLIKVCRTDASHYRRSTSYEAQREWGLEQEVAGHL